MHRGRYCENAERQILFFCFFSFVPDGFVLYYFSEYIGEFDCEIVRLFHSDIIGLNEVFYA